jgi:polysaccharide biosynthesis transport protein
VDRDSLCCVITSPTAAEGKSTVAANLAIALTQAGRRVALVDADLRKPSLHRLFGLQQRVGTTTVLLDQADAFDALQQLNPGLPTILTSGQLPPNPSELLGSRRMLQLIEELRGGFDVILVDCAPLLPVTDPMVVSRFADGILLIARAATTTRDQVQAARNACLKAGATVFGTVLNAATVAEGDQSAYYAYYGEGRQQPVAPDAGVDLIAGNGSLPHRLVNGRAARHSRTRAGGR